MGVPLRGRNRTNRNKSNKMGVCLQPFRLFGLARGPAPTAAEYRGRNRLAENTGGPDRKQQTWVHTHSRSGCSGWHRGLPLPATTTCSPRARSRRSYVWRDTKHRVGKDEGRGEREGRQGREGKGGARREGRGEEGQGRGLLARLSPAVLAVPPLSPPPFQ